jgi:hypothetical protein
MSLATVATVVAVDAIFAFSKLDASNIISVILIMAVSFLAIFLINKYFIKKPKPINLVNSDSRTEDINSKSNQSLIIGWFNTDGSISKIDPQNDLFAWKFIENHWIHKLFFLKFPETLSYDLQPDTILSYDELGYNCSIDYASASVDFHLTIYLYPIQDKDLVQGLVEELEIIRGYYPDLNILSNETFWGIDKNPDDIIQSQLNKNTSMVAGLAFKVKERSVKSYLILTHSGPLRIKIRATWPASSQIDSKVPLIFLLDTIKELTLINNIDIFGIKNI